VVAEIATRTFAVLAFLQANWPITVKSKCDQYSSKLLEVSDAIMRRKHLQTVCNAKRQSTAHIPYIATSEIAEADVRKGTTSYTALLHKPLHIDGVIQIAKIDLDIFQPRCGPNHPFEQSHVAQ
jgi:hypothetical protein